MSQIYTWINYDKMEILDSWCSKLWESDYTGCEQNNAVLTLLAGRWSGDRLIWYGCEGLDMPSDNRPFLKEIEDVSVEDRFYDSQDISGLFRENEGRLHWVDSEDGSFSGDIPYEGPFEMSIEWYRYVVNVDKRQFIDRERAPVRSASYRAVSREDLFPALCCPGDYEPQFDEVPLGTWFGDVIAATNERPGEGYEDLSHLHSHRGRPCPLSDAEILAYINEGAPRADLIDESDREFIAKKLDELLAGLV